jgi:hypothetical protein
MIQPMRDNPRTTVVSVLLGVVLLGGVFAFTVLVPKIGDQDAASAESSATADPLPPVVLPDELAGGLEAVDLGTLPAELAQKFGDVDALKKQEDSIAEGLDRVFGVPGSFRVYAAADGSAVAQVTVLDKAPGLFTPDALPIDPKVINVARAPSDLVDVDGATCSINWGEAVPAGTAIDPAAMPQGVRCQLGQDDRRTYELTSQGLSVDDSVAILKKLAATA